MDKDYVLFRACECLSEQMDFNRKLVKKIIEMQEVINLLVEYSNLSGEAICSVLNKKE